ncbi:MAG TPA: peptidoglycan editing factor PgeF [Rudaea sp.]|jgi:YfiH family protein|nr:peptidoglycan editing factor PgeF [Rudaea sp.]
MPESRFAANVIVPDWPAPPRVHAFTTARTLPGNSLPPYDAFNLGLRSGEDESIVRANRALLERAFNLPASPRWLQQVHGDRVLRMTCELPDGEPQADAVFSAEPGVVLVIQTADCLPILLCADDGSEIAAIHAGWRGLAGGVIEACVRRLTMPPSRLLAWLGPAIGPASYEVGEEVRVAFVESDPAAESAFAATRPGHWHCDLYALARRRLAALGVTRIHGGGFDTLADARFYSYRRDGARSGRMASLIWLKTATDSA